MPMYSWKSEAIGDWSSGLIVVCARNVRKARKQVLAAAKKDDLLRTLVDGLARDMQAKPCTDTVVFKWGGS